VLAAPGARSLASIAIRIREIADESPIGRKIAEAPRAYANRCYVGHMSDPNGHKSAIAPRRRIRRRDRHLAAARWIRSAAPRAKIAAGRDNWAAFEARAFFSSPFMAKELTAMFGSAARPGSALVCPHRGIKSSTGS
jgi:hypothetical protein